MQVHAFHDPITSTLTYIVFDPDTRDAVAIDPVLDYDPVASRTSTTSLERLGAFIDERELRLHHVLETHTHADHLSGSQWLRVRYGARLAIGERIREVQRTLAHILDLPHVATDGSQFDRLLADGEIITAGSLRVETIATPGHTPVCVTYRVDDALFTGDALFMHDHGTGRCDFHGGSASALYDSVARLYLLPDATRVFPGHDYQPGGRAVLHETSIGRSKRSNAQLRAVTTKDEFVAIRWTRDRALPPPRLLYPSVEVNIDAGRLPPPRANGQRYLTIPITTDAATPVIDVDPAFVATHRSDVVLVDVREPYELAGELGHIAGVQPVPIGTLGEAARTWDLDLAIVLVCRSGGRSAAAAKQLAERGFRRLHNLRGGMLAWNAAGLPIELAA